MKMTSSDSQSTQPNNKKEVTFHAMESLERNSNYIDRLTSLVSDMKMTMDRKKSPYKPRIYQGRSRNQNSNWQFFHPGTDPLVEEEIKVEIGEIILIETIIDRITEIG